MKKNQIERHLLDGPKFLYAFIVLFSLLIFVHLNIIAFYVDTAQKNFVESVKQETSHFIMLKKEETFDLATSISLNKKFIKAMKNGEYDKLYDKNFFAVPQQFQAFKHIGIHIVDKNGVNRYLSWTHKTLGENVLPVREDLRKFYKNPKPMSVISVGKFDLTFKAIIPIYNANNFLGVVEVITHFNSISKNLAKEQIYTALAIDKRFKKQLIHPFSKLFINGYNISTLDLNKNIKKLLQQKGIEYFINKKEAFYIREHFYENGYYVTHIPIKGISGDKIGYFIVFIYDKYGLKNKEDMLFCITILMSLLFFVVAIFFYKAYKKNVYLIETLNQRVDEETEKNLSLIYHDVLTKAYTKEKFLADVELYKNKQLVMLNIKNFSQINAIYGFDTGDEVLKIVAKKLKEILNTEPYRIDADEFIFISDDVENDVKKIRETFKKHSIYLAFHNVNLRLSFSFSSVAGNRDNVLSKLSIALKLAKQEPFKLYVEYKDEKRDDSFIKFNAYLYDAIFIQKEAKIVPYFQGIMNNKTKKIRKYESLARLEVNGKIYSPYFFINVAKNSGFLFEITKIMIDKSFEYLSKKDKDVIISINITEDDLLSKTLKDYLLEKLAQYNLSASRIVLEILEGISASGTKHNIAQLKELKEIGFSLAIDDFGVEYSNFERINTLDVDFIKIDAKYIKSIDTNPKSYKIAKAITEFAHSMGIRVIAEFVENESIQKIIEELGIEFSQGYYFSQPAEEFLE